ncbi:metalloendopeptidase, partial [Coemansia sp. RSA 2618]
VALANYGGADVCRAATFGHPMQGYDCRYYSFMWAAVFSADMFAARFAKDNESDSREDRCSSNAGMAYRTEILQLGGTRDPLVSIERFLGRKPSNRAFLQAIGLADAQ